MIVKLHHVATGQLAGTVPSAACCGNVRAAVHLGADVGWVGRHEGLVLRIRANLLLQLHGALGGRQELGVFCVDGVCVCLCMRA